MEDSPPEPTALPMAGSPVRERADAAANRVRILGAAREILATDGPEGLTMDAVAAAAGVGKGTVFRRFGDRSGLAEALIDEGMRAFQDALLHGPPPLGPGAPAPERLEAFVVAFLRHQAENLDVALLATTARGRRGSPVLDALLLHLRTLLEEDPGVDDGRALAQMVLGAFGPEVVQRLRLQGVGQGQIESAAVALLRGLWR